MSRRLRGLYMLGIVVGLVVGDTFSPNPMFLLVGALLCFVGAGLLWLRVQGLPE